jgi:pimeloyl-ACP methyl ester carboxylesterase
VEPESGFVDAGGTRLHYLVWRADAGDAPEPVLLAHATGFLARLWEPVAVLLAAAGYDVWAYDARGHGDSEKPAPAGDNYHWLRFVEDMRAFLAATGLRGLAFVGHSAGGAAGLYLAGQDAGVFTRLAVIEPIVMPGGAVMDESRRQQMAEGARRRRHVFASREEMVSQYRQRPTFERWPDEMLQLYADCGTNRREDGQVELKCPGDIEGEIFANSGALNVWDALPNIGVPVMVVEGEHTEQFLSMVAGGVAQRVPQGRLEKIEDAGHLAPMERPELVANLLLKFLRDDG